MSDLRNLYRDASHYLGGQVAVLALGFVSFPIFVRVLSVAEYGMLCLTLQVASMATVLSKMGLQNSVQRFYQEHAVSHDSNALRRFYSTLLFGATLSAVAIAVLFVLGLQLTPDSLVSNVFKKILFFASGLSFTQGLMQIVMNFLRAQRRTTAFNVTGVLTKATGIAIVCLLLFAWNRSVKAVLIGTIMVEATSIILLIVWLFPRGVISLSFFDYALLRGALVFGLPLVGYELAGVILDSGDRILVQHYLGFQALGYYAVGYNLSNYIATSVMYPVNLALLPIYMKLWVSHGEEETRLFLSRSMDKFIMVAMCVLATVAVTARDVVTILGSRKLEQAYPLMPVLVLGLMVYSLHIFFNAGLIIHKRTFTMAKIVTLSAALNMSLNVLLIPRIGLQGAAVATLLSYVVFVVLIARASFPLLPLRLDNWATIRYVVAALISVLLSSRVQCSSSLFNLAIRGILSVFVFGAALWGIDRRFRVMVSDAVQIFAKRQSELTTA